MSVECALGPSASLEYLINYLLFYEGWVGFSRWRPGKGRYPVERVLGHTAVRRLSRLTWHVSGFKTGRDRGNVGGGGMGGVLLAD